MPSRDNLEAWDGAREKEVSLRYKRFIGCIEKIFPPKASPTLHKFLKLEAEILLDEF